MEDSELKPVLSDKSPPNSNKDPKMDHFEKSPPRNQNKMDHFEKLKITCGNCGKPSDYKFNENKIAKRPRKTCHHCKKRFNINRKRLISLLTAAGNQDKDHKMDHFEKSPPRKRNKMDHFEKLAILESLDKQKTIKEVSREMAVPYLFLWRFVKRLESKKYITRISKYPALYKMDHSGKIYVSRLKNSIKQINNSPSAKSPSSTSSAPSSLAKNQFRIHDVRLGYDPTFGSWPHELLSIPAGTTRTDVIEWGGVKYSIGIKRVDRVPMYFIFYFPTPLFNGLTTARVYRTRKKTYSNGKDTKAVHYVFDRKKWDPKSEFVDVDKDKVGLYLQDRINDTINAQTFLERNYGITVSDRDRPEWVKDPHFEIHYANGTMDDMTLPELHRYFKKIEGKMHLENGTTLWNDDSLQTGSGNLETEDLDTAIILGKDQRPPNPVDNRLKIETIERSLPVTISEAIMKNLSDFKTEFTQELTVQMSKAVGDAVATAIKQVITPPKGDDNNPLTI